MATTSMWAIKYSLGKAVSYVKNPEKTENPDFIFKDKITEKQINSLGDVIEYTSRNEKTAMRQFVSGVNCFPDTALLEMMEVKKRFNKTGGRLGFHGYQSFAPGEISPELAHEIGKELANRLWGDDYQVVVTTHLDKDNHIHSHFVINSVAFTNGLHYENNKADYKRMRTESDKLCKEYGLSVIETTKGKGKHYSEWQAEKSEKPTMRSMIKNDVDRAIRESMTDREFFSNLKSMGYEIKQGKDITIKATGRERGVKLERNFGDDYSLENIKKRILANEEPEKSLPVRKIKHIGRVSGIKKPKRKISGYYALYLRYQYLLGYLPRGSPKRNAKMHALLKEDIRKLDKIIDETKLLADNKIETAEQLFSYRETLTAKTEKLVSARDELRKELRRKSSVGKQDEIKFDISSITNELKGLRKEIRMTENIAERSGIMKEKIDLIREETISKEKEEKEYGQFRRNR